METLDFDYTEMMDDRHNPTADARLFVVFHVEPLRNVEKSEAAGRAIFDECEFVRIMVPGDKHQVVDRVATTDDKQRFARQYEAFQKRTEQNAHGTPLAQWPMVTRAMVAEFAYLGITTVEQLAHLNDDLKSRIPGGTMYSQKAQEFLGALVNNDALATQLAAQKQETETLKAQMAELLAAQKAAPAQAPRPGAR